MKTIICKMLILAAVLALSCVSCDNPLADLDDPEESEATADAGNEEIGIGGMYDYLVGQSGGQSTDDPIELKLSLQLTEEAWRYILATIEFADKYVSLNISGCTRSCSSSSGGLRLDGTFDPVNYFSTGKDKIVSLVLPQTAASIIDNTNFFNYGSGKIF